MNRDRTLEPTSAMSEGELMAGYAIPAAAEPCACGALLVSDPDHASIARALERHQATRQHVAWREWQEARQ